MHRATCNLLFLGKLNARLRTFNKDALIQEPFDNQDRVYSSVGSEMRRLDREALWVALLNTRYRPIKFERISHGTVNESSARQREILKPAIIHSPYAFISCTITLVAILGQVKQTSG